MLRKTGLVALASPLLVAACGGGGGGGASGPITQFPVDLTTVQPEATGVVTAADFRGQSFPMSYVYSGAADLNGFQGFQKRGTGRVSFSPNGDTVTVQFEDGGEEVQLTRTFSSSSILIYDDGSGGLIPDLDIQVSFSQSRAAANVNFRDRRRDLYPADGRGIIGFATPDVAIPSSGSARFQSRGSAVEQGRTNSFWIIAEGEEIRDTFSPTGTAMDITVDFATGGATGKLFAGRTTIDYEGEADNFRTDDELGVTVSLQNGQLSNGSLTGQASLAAQVDIDGAGTDLRDLSPDTTGSNVDGRLFGDAAQTLGGAYDGQGSVIGPDGSRAGIVFGGTFLGDQ